MYTCLYMHIYICIDKHRLFSSPSNIIDGHAYIFTHVYIYINIYMCIYIDTYIYDIYRETPSFWWPKEYH